MTPTISDTDQSQFDDLIQGREIFTLRCSSDTYSNWEDNHIAAFESTPKTDQSSWE